MAGWHVLAALAATGGGEAPQRPIVMVTEPAGDAVRIQVIGDAAAETRASYTLEVASDPAAGGNRSVQRGTARLRPGERAKLLDLTLGNVAKGGWTAKLTVDPERGERYVVDASSAG